MEKEETRSDTSPLGGKRACLCKNGTYSSECCTGEFHNQGIGNVDTTTTTSTTIVNNARVNVTTH